MARFYPPRQFGGISPSSILHPQSSSPSSILHPRSSILVSSPIGDPTHRALDIAPCPQAIRTELQRRIHPSATHSDELENGYCCTARLAAQAIDGAGIISVTLNDLQFPQLDAATAVKALQPDDPRAALAKLATE
jgi:hypothetical protein